MRRAEVNYTGRIMPGREVPALGQFTVETSHGEFQCADGQGLNVGTIEAGALLAVTIIILREQGGDAPRIGLVHQLSADEAREIAASLIHNAELIENAAADAASATIKRARAQ